MWTRRQMPWCIMCSNYALLMRSSDGLSQMPARPWTGGGLCSNRRVTSNTSHIDRSFQDAGCAVSWHGCEVRRIRHQPTATTPATTPATFPQHRLNQLGMHSPKFLFSAFSPSWLSLSPSPSPQFCADENEQRYSPTLTHLHSRAQYSSQSKIHQFQAENACPFHSPALAGLQLST
jgi:hypothetical protein